MSVKFVGCFMSLDFRSRKEVFDIWEVYNESINTMKHQIEKSEANRQQKLDEVKHRSKAKNIECEEILKNKEVSRLAIFTGESRMTHELLTLLSLDGHGAAPYLLSNPLLVMLFYELACIVRELSLIWNVLAINSGGKSFQKGGKPAEFYSTWCDIMKVDSSHHLSLHARIKDLLDNLFHVHGDKPYTHGRFRHYTELLMVSATEGANIVALLETRIKKQDTIDYIGIISGKLEPMLQRMRRRQANSISHLKQHRERDREMLIRMNCRNTATWSECIQKLNLINPDSFRPLSFDEIYKVHEIMVDESGIHVCTVGDFDVCI